MYCTITLLVNSQAAVNKTLECCTSTKCSTCETNQKMSKPIDYSKFDNIGDSDCDNENENQKHSIQNHQQSPSPLPSPPSTNPLTPSTMTKRDPSTGRYIFECNNRKIYEWEQSLEEVNIYIETPDGASVRAADLDIRIEPNRLKVGMKNRDRLFLDEVTFGTVDTLESSWYLDKDSGSSTANANASATSTIHIILIKAHRGQVWDAALLGRDGRGAIDGTAMVDPLTKEAIRKDMMLERFQEENPGFDFRSAQFNGEIPNPREFMGGVSYR